MSEINSVTENRVTVTANDTEANIRAAAGFAEPKAEPVVDDEADVNPLKAEKAADESRNPDGTFKSKAVETPEPAKKADGDPRTSHQAKINRAIGAQREAERKAAALEAELAAYKAPKPVQAAPAPVEPAATPAPKYVELVKQYAADPDFPNFDDFTNAGFNDPLAVYQAAVAAFITDKKESERETRTAHQRAQTAQATRIQTVMSTAAERYQDFETLLAADTTVYPPAVLAQFADEDALDPDSSADLMHHLLTHPDDAARLAGANSPIAAAREVGRLLAGLSSAHSGPETPPLRQTNAKPLIKPVRPSLVAPESSPPEDLAFGPAYIKAMNEKEKREARRA